MTLRSGTAQAPLDEVEFDSVPGRGVPGVQ